MNYKAIDAGVDAVHKVEVPESWKNPEADAPAKEKTGRPEVVKMVKTFLSQSLLWMVTAFLYLHSKILQTDSLRLGASAYEKRGTAVMVPEWDPDIMYPV